MEASDEAALAGAPVEDLLELPLVRGLADSTQAYLVAKRANQVRVQAAALAWNRRGARIDSISPGVISTPMARAEAASGSGSVMMLMLEDCGIGRMGTTDELAEAVAYLVGLASRFITGTDLIVDGGQAAWVRWHMPQ
jgi:NAD(P)-dependent dehydrogenase (short-subunit alcohol dehydrogenase family)